MKAVEVFKLCFFKWTLIAFRQKMNAFIMKTSFYYCALNCFKATNPSNKHMFCLQAYRLGWDDRASQRETILPAVCQTISSGVCKSKHVVDLSCENQTPSNGFCFSQQKAASIFGCTPPQKKILTRSQVCCNYAMICNT